jgi:sRNA-binding carbon storage regulator CsrA
MLVLTRKKDQRIIINIPPNWKGGEILLSVSDIVPAMVTDNGMKREARVKIGIHAPPEIILKREELVRQPITIPTKENGIKS